jgi:hypothetical protein
MLKQTTCQGMKMNNFAQIGQLLSLASELYQTHNKVALALGLSFDPVNVTQISDLLEQVHILAKDSGFPIAISFADLEKRANVFNPVKIEKKPVTLFEKRQEDARKASPIVDEKGYYKDPQLEKEIKKSYYPDVPFDYWYKIESDYHPYDYEDYLNDTHFDNCVPIREIFPEY